MFSNPIYRLLIVWSSTKFLEIYFGTESSNWLYPNLSERVSSWSLVKQLNKKLTSFEERAVSSKFNTNYFKFSLTVDKEIDTLLRTVLKSLWEYSRVSF